MKVFLVLIVINIDMFYVYAYLRKSDNTPYYIGKGKDTRAYGKHNVSVPKDRSKVIFLETNLTEDKQLDKERKILAHKNRAAENEILRRKRASETKQNYTIEEKKIISERISNAKKGKQQRTLTCPHCQKIGGYSVMPRHHFDNCKQRSV